MNRYSIEVSDSAKLDILDIARYITAQLSTPKAALDTVDKLHEGMHSLQTNPKRQPLVQDERLAAKGYRVLPVKNYLIFYKVYDKPTKLVDIVRILYGHRNWADLL